MRMLERILGDFLNFAIAGAAGCLLIFLAGCDGGGSGRIAHDPYTSPVSETPLVVSWPLTKAYPDIEYNIRLGVVGGKYPYGFTLTESPAGMTVDVDCGEISWTPAASLIGQTFPVSILITDTLSRQTTEEFDVTVATERFYFVSPDGDDDTGDGSRDTPWQSINHAIDQGTTDDILYIRAGRYNGRIELDRGNINKWIAYPGDDTPLLDLEFSGIHPKNDYNYFDGFEIMNSKRYMFGTGGTGYSVWRRNHMHHAYDNSRAENPSFIWLPGWGDVNKHTNVVIQDSVFHDLFDRGYHIDEYSNFHGAGPGVLYDGSYVLIEDNEIYNIDGRGLYDKDGGNKNTFRGNYIHDTWYAALDLGNQGGMNGDEALYNICVNTPDTHAAGFGTHRTDVPYENVWVHHNTFIGYLSAGRGSQRNVRFTDNIAVSDDNPMYNCCGETTDPLYITPRHYTIDYNSYWSTASYFSGIAWKPEAHKTFAEWQAIGHDNNSIMQQPQFVDAAHGDYTPVAGSLVCGAGHDGADIGAVPCGSPSSAVYPDPDDTRAPIVYAPVSYGVLDAGGGTYTVANTDERALCKYSTTPGVSFADKTNTYPQGWATLHGKRFWNLADGPHVYYIRCQDEAGNTNQTDFVIAFHKGTDTISDFVAPSAPTNAAAFAILASEIALSWDASSDNTAVIGYKIYRDGILLTALDATSFVDTRRRSDTEYAYTVSAFDSSGNEGEMSTAVIVRTLVGSGS